MITAHNFSIAVANAHKTHGVITGQVIPARREVTLAVFFSGFAGFTYRPSIYLVLQVKVHSAHGIDHALKDVLVDCHVMVGEKVKIGSNRFGQQAGAFSSAGVTGLARVAKEESLV